MKLYLGHPPVMSAAWLMSLLMMDSCRPLLQFVRKCRRRSKKKSVRDVVERQEAKKGLCFRASKMPEELLLKRKKIFLRKRKKIFYDD